MRKYPLYITLVWIALGIFASAYSIKHGLGNLRSPGPGFFPCLLGVIICGLALYKLITEFLGRAHATEADKEIVPAETKMPSGVGRLVFIALTLFVYALLLEWLGYLITTLLTMILLLRFSGYTQWTRIIAYGVIIAGVSYFTFLYLGVSFPAGVLRYFGLY